MFSRVRVFATAPTEKKTRTGRCPPCVAGSTFSSLSPNAPSVRRIILHSEFPFLVQRNLLNGVVLMRNTTQPVLLYGVPFSQPVRAVMWLMLYKRLPFEMIL